MSRGISATIPAHEMWNGIIKYGAGVYTRIAGFTRMPLAVPTVTASIR